MPLLLCSTLFLLTVFLFIHCVCMSRCLHEFLCTTLQGPAEAREECEVPQNCPCRLLWATAWCWDVSSGPLEKQPVPFAAEPALQLQFLSSLCLFNPCTHDHTLQEEAGRCLWVPAQPAVYSKVHGQSPSPKIHIYKISFLPYTFLSTLMFKPKVSITYKVLVVLCDIKKGHSLASGQLCDQGRYEFLLRQ